MMGIVMLETCWAYKKYNKKQVAYSWFFILQLALFCDVYFTIKLPYIFLHDCHLQGTYNNVVETYNNETVLQ